MREDVHTVTLTDLARKAHQGAVDKGFWDENAGNQIGTQLMLIVSELTEVLEADRKGTLHQVSEKIPVITNFEEEMADTVIRILDVVGAHKLNLELAISMKMKYNESRGHKHGKRY